ncbi:MAG TPA: hypothetical protein VGM05_27960 [Planctomycetaceae bacterium]|jgi:hypothetical protein
MPSHFCSRSLLLCLALNLCAGCSDRVSPPTTVPVSGKVLLNGEPVAGIRVKMHPMFNMGRIEWGVVGETGPTGEFTLGTGAPGNGAPPGEYVVTFTKPRIASDLEHNGVEIEVDDFEGKYNDPDNSDWTVTITDGDNELEPFLLN